MQSAADCCVMVTDDDADERYLIDMAFKEIGLKGKVLFAEDGEILLRSLGVVGTDRMQKTLPCLILLDLNMPRMDGREALRALKQDDRLKRIPVVILTNSKSTDDVDGSYRDGANSYFSKPLGYSELVDLMRLIRNYWLRGAALPSRG